MINSIRKQNWIKNYKTLWFDNTDVVSKEIDFIEAK